MSVRVCCLLQVDIIKCSKMLALFCIHAIHLNILHLYSSFLVVYSGPHGRLVCYTLKIKTIISFILINNQGP